MIRLLRSEPALLGGFLNALVLVLSVFVFHWDAEQVAAIQGLALAFTALLVRTAVTPVAKVVPLATEVATKTVEKLDGSVIGAVGAVSGTAKGIIHSTVNEVLGPFTGGHE